MSLLATIATGNVDAADVFFLIAVILFVIAGVAFFATVINDQVGRVAAAFGLASTALALLLL
jgi:hypothetical protein